MKKTVKEIVDKNLYFCHPFKSNFLHTPRWDVITAYIKNFDFKVGCELGVSTGENFFYLLEKNEDLFLYAVPNFGKSLTTAIHDMIEKQEDEVLFGDLLVDETLGEAYVRHT